MGEIPIARGQRAVWTVLGVIGIILAGVGTQFLYQNIIVPTEPVMDMWTAIGAVLAILGIVMTALGFRVLIMTQRTKKG
jgi:uncharacterized membrane protein